MDLKLNIYKDKYCRELARQVTAKDFELSTGICEDVLDVINIDALDGGFFTLSPESKTEIAIGIVRNGFPFFKEIMQELFDISEEEIRYTKISEIANVVIQIVNYSKKELVSSLGGKHSKN
jgi:hypothetical protein